MVDEERNLRRDVWIGVGLYLLMGPVSALIYWVAALLFDPMGSGLSGIVGLVVYVLLTIGLIVWARRSKRWGIFKGWLIALSVVFLLMAACFGIFWLLALGMRAK